MMNTTPQSLPWNERVFFPVLIFPFQIVHYSFIFVELCYNGIELIE